MDKNAVDDLSGHEVLIHQASLNAETSEAVASHGDPVEDLSGSAEICQGLRIPFAKLRE